MLSQKTNMGIEASIPHHPKYSRYNARNIYRVWANESTQVINSRVRLQRHDIGMIQAVEKYVTVGANECPRKGCRPRCGYSH